MNKKSLSMSYSVKRSRCKQFFRVMRITTLLLFVFIFCMHAENSSSQNVNVTIKRSNTELENVLNDIEKQTDYLFIYNKFVNVDRKVSVNLKKASLEEVLANLFAGTDVKYSVDGSYKEPPPNLSERRAARSNSLECK